MDTNTGSERTFMRIQEWLTSCQEHELCRKWPEVQGVPGKLPSRLLEIYSVGLHPKVRLVVGESMPPGTCYATLSHCWGGTLPIVLRQDCIDDFLNDISWASLPKTFQDALVLINRLGIKYLWIDALCIIQDNDLDWTVEARHMRHIYANSALNISADHAKNSHQGLFVARDVEHCTSFSPPGENETSRCVILDDRWYSDIMEAPLNSRAWVLQERFLPPRVVHFGATQVYWECTTVAAPECLPFYQYPPDVHTIKKWSGNITNKLAQDPGSLEMYDIWDSLVRLYALNRLSFESDRSVAISGLAEAFCHHLGLQANDYICGMWRPRFVQELMWHRTWGFGDISHHTPGISAPSWSWLSVTPRSLYLGTRDDEYRALNQSLVKTTTTLVDAQSNTQGNDPFGKVLGGHILLRGPLCTISLSFSDEARQIGKDWRIDVTLGSTVFQTGSQWMPMFALDDISPEALQSLHQAKVYLLLCVISFYDDGSRPTSWLGIYPAPYKFDLLPLTVPEYRKKALKPIDPLCVHYTHPTARAFQYESLVLRPTEQETAFRRIGTCRFRYNYPGLQDGSIEPEENGDEASWWISLQAALFRQFRANDVPAGLCDRVDKDMKYTVKIV